MKVLFSRWTLELRKETNEALIKMYDCRDIGGFSEVTFLWIHPIYQNLCRTQWPRVGNNIDYRDNRFAYVT